MGINYGIIGNNAGDLSGEIGNFNIIGIQPNCDGGCARLMRSNNHIKTVFHIIRIAFNGVGIDVIRLVGRIQEVERTADIAADQVFAAVYNTVHFLIAGNRIIIAAFLARVGWAEQAEQCAFAVCIRRAAAVFTKFCVIGCGLVKHADITTGAVHIERFV